MRTHSKRLNLDIRDRPTLGISQATTSGTAFDYSGIPSWVHEVIVMFVGVSLSGTDDLLVQIGDSGGLETTGYTSGSGSAGNSTAGMIIRVATAARAVHGMLVLGHMGGNKWVSTHSVHVDTNLDFAGGGTKALTGTLDRLRITRTGTDTFDAGSVNIMYR